MCEPTTAAAGLQTGLALFGTAASVAIARQNARQQANALKRANKPAPPAPTQASAGVRDAALRARRASKSGGQSSTRLTNPLGLPGGVGQGKTLLGE